VIVTLKAPTYVHEVGDVLEVGPPELIGGTWYREVLGHGYYVLDEKIEEIRDWLERLQPAQRTTEVNVYYRFKLAIGGFKPGDVALGTRQNDVTKFVHENGDKVLVHDASFDHYLEEVSMKKMFRFKKPLGIYTVGDVAEGSYDVNARKHCFLDGLSVRDEDFNEYLEPARPDKSTHPIAFALALKEELGTGEYDWAGKAAIVKSFGLDYGTGQLNHYLRIAREHEETVKALREENATLAKVAGDRQNLIKDLDAARAERDARTKERDAAWAEVEELKGKVHAAVQGHVEASRHADEMAALLERRSLAKRASSALRAFWQRQVDHSSVVRGFRAVSTPRELCQFMAWTAFRLGALPMLVCGWVWLAMLFDLRYDRVVWAEAQQVPMPQRVEAVDRLIRATKRRWM
jgi:hypothetical protein